MQSSCQFYRFGHAEGMRRIVEKSCRQPLVVRVEAIDGSGLSAGMYRVDDDHASAFCPLPRFEQRRAFAALLQNGHPFMRIIFQTARDDESNRVIAAIFVA